MPVPTDLFGTSKVPGQIPDKTSSKKYLFHYPNQKVTLTIGICCTTPCSVSQSIIPRTKKTSRKPVNKLAKEQAETLTNEFFYQLEKLNFDPLVKLVQICNDAFTPPAVKASIAMELLSYKFPKKKAVDLTASASGEPIKFITINFELAPGQQQKQMINVTPTVEAFAEAATGNNSLADKVVQFGTDN